MRPKLNVLVVDDSRVARAYFEKILAGENWRVESVANGTDALDTLKATRYDLILLDLNLPDIDGLEVLRILRKTDKETCVMIITAHSGVQSAIAAGQQGADGYVEKEEIMGPEADSDQIFHRINQSMQIREGHRTAAELDRIRSELYAMVTHDLRNPITIIQLATAMIVDNLKPDDNGEGRKLVDMIQNNSQSMLEQLEDFLEFARLGSGAIKLNSSTADLPSLVADLWEEMRILARKHKHKLVLKISQDHYEVQIDVRRIRQMLSNLIGNAIKYTPDRGTITLGLLTQDDHYTLMVSDTGIGVPEDQHDRLFTRYWRARNAEDSKIKGTGLGLLIVRQIAESHGGHVWHRPHDGGGSIFGITIPRNGIQNE